ncbi:hypothetical protein EGW08_004503 [Elysia chlorotica]|uniref:Uncharacterized protein n=1 Tax=Elysia chlorotica TaxID=188477 RepID=A0A3S1BNE9_ELYCH|nr:hypothetical protein EGW08_004503 [Elysia chlorotica]
MSSQAKINAYMERHRIGPLFEDLMNKTLRDMPEEPLVYLLRTIYKKAGIEIPQTIRYGGLRKSTHELTKSVSPERPSRSADVTGSRDYEKPWATSPTRRTKPKKSEEGSKSKPDWNSDNKTKHLSSFDELWEGGGAGAGPAKKDRAVSSSAGVRKSKAGLSSSINAWASVGLEDNDEQYTSPPHRQQKFVSTRMTEEELLASEVLVSSRKSQDQKQLRSGPEDSGTASCSARERKGEIKKHRQHLGEILTQTRETSNDSGVGSDLSSAMDDDDDNDAIELLENADDLRREGVVNIPRTGYKLSRNLRHRENEPRVKLNINVNPEQFDSWQGMAREVDSLETPRSSPEQVDFEEEDEFESVSQVTGPRQPVWKVPGSDGDNKPGTSIPLRPPVADETPSQHHRRTTNKSAHPAPSRERSVEDAEELSASAKPWSEGANQVSFDESPDEPLSSRSLNSAATSGGWNIPDDTELGSAYDWNQRVRSGAPRDPRAY